MSPTISVAEAAHRCGLTVATVRAYCASGRWPATRTETGRWRLDEAAFEALTNPPPRTADPVGAGGIEKPAQSTTDAPDSLGFPVGPTCPPAAPNPVPVGSTEKPADFCIAPPCGDTKTPGNSSNPVPAPHDGGNALARPAGWLIVARPDGVRRAHHFAPGSPVSACGLYTLPTADAGTGTNYCARCREAGAEAPEEASVLDAAWWNFDAVNDRWWAEIKARWRAEAAAIRGEAPRPASESWPSVLGVAPNASPGEVRAAFRRLALAHHPDQGGDPERLRAVVAALEEYRRAVGGEGATP